MTNTFTDQNKKLKLFCERHGWSKHETKDCYAKEEGKDSITPVKPPPKNPTPCWNTGCKEEYTPQHREICKFKRKAAEFRNMEVESETPDDFLTSDDDESPIFSIRGLRSRDCGP
jgi:hypothetical protein